MLTQGPSYLPAAPRNRSPLASSSASSEAVPERRARRMRGRTRRKSMDVTAGMCLPVCLSVPVRSVTCCWVTTYHLIFTRLSPGPVIRVSGKTRTPVPRWVTSTLTQNLLFLQRPKTAASRPPTPPPWKLSLSWGPGRRGARRGTSGRSIMLREWNSGWTRGEDPVTVLKTKKHSTDFWVCALSGRSGQGPAESHIGGSGSGIMLKSPRLGLWAVRGLGGTRHRGTLILLERPTGFSSLGQVLSGSGGGYRGECSMVKTSQNKPRAATSAHWDTFTDSLQLRFWRSAMKTQLRSRCLYVQGGRSHKQSSTEISCFQSVTNAGK